MGASRPVTAFESGDGLRRVVIQDGEILLLKIGNRWPRLRGNHDVKLDLSVGRMS